jgi:hypothetical protein
VKVTVLAVLISDVNDCNVVLPRIARCVLVVVVAAAEALTITHSSLLNETTNTNLS